MPMVTLIRGSIKVVLGIIEPKSRTLQSIPANETAANAHERARWSWFNSGSVWQSRTVAKNHHSSLLFPDDLILLHNKTLKDKLAYSPEMYFKLSVYVLKLNLQ